MTADDLRRQVSALWLFHGATVERALEFSASQMHLAEHSGMAEPNMRAAAGEERAKIIAALDAFRELGEGLQK